MRYIYKILLLLIIIYTGIFPVFADEIEWVDPQEKTLRLKESFVRESYLIEASDFYDNTALITVYDTDYGLLTRNITRINDSLVINDALNITVVDLQERLGNISASRGLNVVVDQWVKLRTRTAGRPAPKVSIIPHEKQVNNKTTVSRIFIPGSEIFINFSIKNEGKAVLKNLTLEINSTLPLFSGEKLNYELPNLMAGNESDIITVRFIAPLIKEREAFTISAEVKGNDVFGKAYKAGDSAYIEVIPLIGIPIIDLRKYISEKVYMGDVAVVSISIKNNGSQIIDNVSLIESIPAGLVPLDILTWNFTLGAYEQKSISYKVKPTKPGTYFFLPGSSLIEYQGRIDYNKKLNKLIVNGPFVVLMKSANISDPVKGQNINIRVEAKNIGDATAIVKLSDDVPADYSLSNVEEEYFTMVLNTKVLRPGSSVSFSYVLNTTTAGSYVLPPAKATVLDQFLYEDERYTQRSVSNEPVINVSEPASLKPPLEINITPKPTVAVPTSTVLIPKPSAGFEGYNIMLIIIIWVIKKRIQN